MSKIPIDKKPEIFDHGIYCETKLEVCEFLNQFGCCNLHRGKILDYQDKYILKCEECKKWWNKANVARNYINSCKKDKL